MTISFIRKHLFFDLSWNLTPNFDRPIPRGVFGNRTGMLYIKISVIISAFQRKAREFILYKLEKENQNNKTTESLTHAISNEEKNNCSLIVLYGCGGLLRSCQKKSGFGVSGLHMEIGFCWILYFLNYPDRNRLEAQTRMLAYSSQYLGL